MRDTHRPFRLWLVMPALIVALCIALAAPAFSQTITTGDVAGVIKDASGAVVPNATITLKNSDTGEVRSVVTGSSGDYRFPLLKPGEYTISAQASGLKSNVERFSVLVGQAAEMNLTLSVTASQQVSKSRPRPRRCRRRTPTWRATSTSRRWTICPCRAAISQRWP